MRRKAYPLRIVQKIREIEELTIIGALRELLRELDSIQARLSKSREAALERKQARERFEAKNALPERGCIGAELHRDALFSRRLLEEERLLQNEIAIAQCRYHRLRMRIDELQSALSAAHAARKIVEQHHQKFDQTQQKQRTSELEMSTEDHD
ncbi:MAG: hypothetical protein JXA30_04135 [Deltaproteobacteria bacterium]|nr:hypothetical protein [Deltaproteobacteria bacterium]